MARDIHPGNILLTTKTASVTGQEIPTVVLCDFGLGKLLVTEPGPSPTTSAGHAQLHSHHAAETMYTAPEVAAGGSYTKEADIYAAGVFMIVAFRSYAEQAELLGRGPAAVRVPKFLWEMCKTSTADNPADRLSAFAVVDELVRFSKDDLSAENFDSVDFPEVLREWLAHSTRRKTLVAKREHVDEDPLTVNSRFAASSVSESDGSEFHYRS